MFRAKVKHDWDQTALLWATIANTVRDSNKQREPFSPGTVHPLRTEADYKPKPIQADITALKAMLR